MIYLILDTNNWIYLANSLDPLTDKLQEGYHFQLFEKLALKAQEKAITILVNDLVESEWVRNQNRCFTLISKYENRMKEDLQTIDRIDQVLQSEFHNELVKLRHAYSTQIYAEIDRNKLHIQSVSTLLESSVKFGTTNEVKIFAADWAVEKKAPFIGDKKNSMADALVLFSTIKYIKDIQSEQDSYSTFIFVSGNKGDFCSKTSGKAIHEDLRDLVNDARINFFLSLPEALKFVDDALFDEIEIQDINADIDNFNLRRFSCLSCSEDDDHDGLNFVEFEPDEEVEDKTVPYVDPSQLALVFNTEEKQKLSKPTIQRGYCLHCETEHIRCHCGQVTSIDFFENGFECQNCGLTYLKEKLPMGGRKEFSYQIVFSEDLDESYD